MKRNMSDVNVDINDDPLLFKISPNIVKYKFPGDKLPRPTKIVMATGTIDKNFLDSFLTIDDDYAQTNARVYLVYLNTYGGVIDDGISIMNFVDYFNSNYNSKIYFVANGKVFSSGVLVFCSGYRRFVLDTSNFLLHNILFYAAKEFNGNTLQDQLTEYTNETIIFKNILKSKTDLSDKDIKFLYDQSRLFNSDQAIKAGIADEYLI